MEHGIKYSPPQSCHCCLQEKRQTEEAPLPSYSYSLIYHSPIIKQLIVHFKACRHSGARVTLHCLNLSIPRDYKYPAKSNIQNLQFFAQYYALNTALQLSVVSREKSIHSRDVSNKQHPWLNTMRDRYMCSFIYKMVIHYSTQEQHRARRFTRSLPLLHLLQKHIKTLHIFSVFILGILRTS